MAGPRASRGTSPSHAIPVTSRRTGNGHHLGYARTAYVLTLMLIYGVLGRDVCNGGAVYLGTSSTATFYNSYFGGNTAVATNGYRPGGGVFNLNRGAVLNVYDSIFTGNRAYYGGELPGLCANVIGALPPSFQMFLPTHIMRRCHKSVDGFQARSVKTRAARPAHPSRWFDAPLNLTRPSAAGAAPSTHPWAPPASPAVPSPATPPPPPPATMSTMPTRYQPAQPRPASRALPAA
jgi:hypothetical protein